MYESMYDSGLQIICILLTPPPIFKIFYLLRAVKIWCSDYKLFQSYGFLNKFWRWPRIYAISP